MRRLATAFLLTCSSSSSRSFEALEARFLELREIHDRQRIASARGLPTDVERGHYAALHREVTAGVAALAKSTLRGEERRAADSMGRMLAEGVVPAPSNPEEPAPTTDPSCAYDATALGDLDALQRRLYACFSRAAHAIEFEGARFDRLTLLEQLARSEAPERRRALFLALGGVFRSVDGDGGPTSPYRALLRLSAARWKERGSPIEHNLKALGLSEVDLEAWLVSILEAWRESTDGTALEPWDWEYAANAAGRLLAEAIPRERLEPLNAAFYAALGADLRALNIHYDLEARAGKTAVAFTDFGARPRRRGRGFTTGEPWVFASYGTGGLGNLGELLHETGHALHIAAIRTRPAFADWPDSDTFTEALADLLALEIYEPEWQRRWLGREASLQDSLRAKYAGIVLDVAWALLEVRLHRDKDADPNAVWSDLTGRYLHVRPHPELSWWARRGQLVDSPGYMMNYALGAILVADLRARCAALRGPLARPDRGYYAWLSERLYRYGLEKPSGAVIREFLGRAPSPDALLADMRRR